MEATLQERRKSALPNMIRSSLLQHLRDMANEAESGSEPEDEPDDTKKRNSVAFQVETGDTARKQLAGSMKKYCFSRRTIDIATRQVDVYALPTSQFLRDNLWRCTVTGPQAMLETQTKVLLLFETTHGGGAAFAIDSLVNHVFGVSFNDSFRYELQLTLETGGNAANADASLLLVALPRVPNSEVQFNLLLVVVVNDSETSILSAVLRVINALTSQAIPKVHSCMAVFDDSADTISEEDLGMLSSFHSAFSDRGLTLIVPNEHAAKYRQKLLATSLRSVEICGLTRTPQSAAAYLQNTSVWRAVLAKLAKADHKKANSSLTASQELAHLEDCVLFAYQSMRQAFDFLVELRRDMDVLDKHKHDVLKAKSFAGSYDVPQVVSLPVQCTNTYCLRCQVVCHENCCVNGTAKVHLCAAAATPKDEPASAFCHYGKCSGVPLGCHWTDHKNMAQIKFVKQLKTTYSSADLARKYEWPDNLKGLAKHLEREYKQQLSEFQSLHNIPRTALEKLRSAAVDSQRMSLVQSTHLKIDEALKRSTDAQLNRVRALLESNEKLLGLYLDQTAENQLLMYEEKKARAVSRKQAANRNPAGAKAEQHSPVHNAPLQYRCNSETGDLVAVDGLGLQGRLTYVPSRVLLEFSSAGSSPAYCNSWAPTGDNKWQKRNTAKLWVDEMESYWLDHPDRRVHKPSARERYEQLRRIREHYKTAADSGNTTT